VCIIITGSQKYYSYIYVLDMVCSIAGGSKYNLD